MPTSIGIIYPPPEVRLIVDKTATFVARNGHEFEEKIRANEITNPKFNFLNPNDPYHAYYQHKVKEIAEGKTITPTSTTAAPSTTTTSQSTAPVTGDNSGTATTTAQTTAQMQKLQLSNKTQDTQARIMEQMIVLKDPPPEFEYLIDTPPISPMEIDIIKLTAQFIARNGRPFLTNIMSKEQRNPMFDFLKPQHSHFNYFTKSVRFFLFFSLFLSLLISFFLIQSKFIYLML